MPAFFLSIAERSLLVREDEQFKQATRFAQERMRASIDDILESHGLLRGTVGSFSAQPDGRVEFVYEQASGEAEPKGEVVEQPS